MAENDERSPILPVDNENSGIPEMNMQWDRALHQFVLILYHYRISPLSLQSAYQDTFSYFLACKSMTVITGTAGSEAEREFMERTMDLMTVIVPRFRKSAFIRLHNEDTICRTKEEKMRISVEKV